MKPKQTPADGLSPASGLPGLLLDSSRGTLAAQKEERRSREALPLAINHEADGNTQTAGTRGANRQTERGGQSESNCCHRLGVVIAFGTETDQIIKT